MTDKQRDDLKMALLVSATVIIFYAMICVAFGR